MRRGSERFERIVIVSTQKGLDRRVHVPAGGAGPTARGALVADHLSEMSPSRQGSTACPSSLAINRLLTLNAEPHPGSDTVPLLRGAIGF